MTISTLFLGFGLGGFDDIKSQKAKALASMYVRVSSVTQAKQMQCLSFLSCFFSFSGFLIPSARIKSK
jgi:hypothetical protein